MRAHRLLRRLAPGRVRPSLSHPEAAPAILVTGSGGVIGRALAQAWPSDRLAPFDLPDGDARDLGALTEAARGLAAIVHLAWDTKAENSRNNGLAPENIEMARNAFEAAAAAGVPRVVIASSVHADTFRPAPAERIDPNRTPVPDSPYGASKVFCEALGRHYAAHRGLEVVAIRFGAVTPDDAPPLPGDRITWLPHRDLVTLVEAAVTEPLPPSGFALAVGVGDSPERVHGYGGDLAWRPGSAS